MNIPEDKNAHLIAGVPVTVGALALVWLATINLGVAVAAAGVAVGVAYEVAQRVRGEGMPEIADAAATALPGVIVGALIFVTKWHF